MKIENNREKVKEKNPVVAKEPEMQKESGKEKNKKKRTEKRVKKAKVKSGYHLFLESKIRELKESPEYASNFYKDYQIGEFSALCSSEWKNLANTEKEIWNEKSKESKTLETKFPDIVPKKIGESSEKKEKSHKKSKFLLRIQAFQQ